MTERNMKIFGVILAIIILGTMSTVGLQLYMNRLFASKGYYKEETAAFLREEETASGEEIPLGKMGGGQSLGAAGSALAGAAKIQEAWLLQADSGLTRAEVVSEETAAGKPDTEEVTITSSYGKFAFESEDELIQVLVESPEVYMEYLGDIELQVEGLYKVMDEADLQERVVIQNRAYRIWDDELNRIYPLVRGSLSESEKENLKYEELGWIRERDARAQMASETANSENVRQFVYTRSLTDTTRERTYYFVEMYFTMKASRKAGTHGLLADRRGHALATLTR